MAHSVKTKITGIFGIFLSIIYISPSAGTELLGAGASFPFPLYSKMFDVYNKQYQIQVDPEKLRAFDIPLSEISRAIKNSNRDIGGSVVEIAEAEYMIRNRGYLKGLSDIEQIPLKVTPQGTPVLLRDVAKIRIGPEMRRGIADLDGQGEVTGGIVVARSVRNGGQLSEDPFHGGAAG